jgi:CHAD domain-containing protein
MSNRAQRTLIRAAEDRRTQIAAGTVAVAGAALAGKAGVERLRENGGSNAGPSRAYRLRSKEKPKSGIRRIARGQAADALEQLQNADAAAVHEARKDLKKLRSLLRLVRDQLGDGIYRAENRRFQEAGRRLSAARDAEVKLETLEGLQERFGEQLQGQGLKPFHRVLTEERAATAEALEANVGPVAESAMEIEEGRKRIRSWPLQANGWDLVGPGLVRLYRRGRRRFKEAQATPTAENVHEWRKRVKDLWYHLRILRDTWPAVVGPAADQAHELSDLLGDHHDLAVLADDARTRRQLFGESGDAKVLLKLTARRQKELLRQAIELGSRLYAEKPKAFGRRLRGYWLASRPR